MKLIISIILILTSLSANTKEPTNSDIKLLVELIKSETKTNRDLMMAYQESNNKRFDSINKRFDDANKRFDTMIYLMVAGFTLIMGYLLKERTSIKSEVRKELEPELIKKADKTVLDNIIAIIEGIAKNDKEVEKLLNKHNLRFA